MTDQPMLRRQLPLRPFSPARAAFGSRSSIDLLEGDEPSFAASNLIDGLDHLGVVGRNGGDDGIVDVDALERRIGD